MTVSGFFTVLYSEPKIPTTVARGCWGEGVGAGGNYRSDWVQAWYPANTTHYFNVGLMLGQCLQRWSSIKPTLAPHVVCACY